MFESIVKDTIGMFNNATCSIVNITGKELILNTTAYRETLETVYTGVKLMMKRESLSGKIQQLVLQGKIKKNEEVFSVTMSALDGAGNALEIDEANHILVKDDIKYKIISDSLRTRKEYYKLSVVKYEQADN